MLRLVTIVVLALSLGLQSKPAAEDSTRVLRSGEDFDAREVALFIELGGDVIVVGAAAAQLPAAVTGVAFDGEAYRRGEPVVLRASPLLGEMTEAAGGRTMSEGPLPAPISFDDLRVTTLLSVDPHATPRAWKTHVPAMWTTAYGEGRIVVLLADLPRELTETLIADASAWLQRGETIAPNPQWHRMHDRMSKHECEKQRAEGTKVQEANP